MGKTALVKILRFAKAMMVLSILGELWQRRELQNPYAYPYRTVFLVVAAVLPAVLLAAGPACADDSVPIIRELSLYADETIEIQTGHLDRLLNLDPELVKATVKEPDALVVSGRKYGTATVRAWGEVGVLILRIRVLGRLPVAKEVYGRKGIEVQPLTLDNRLHYFGYRTGGIEDDWCDVMAHELGASLTRDDVKASGGYWLEEREGQFDIPHYEIMLDQQFAGRVNRAVLHIGTVEADWSQRTFTQKRLEGGRVELHSGVSRPAVHELPASRMGLELMYGKDVKDFVSLGSPTRMETKSDVSLGGGRAWWKPSPVFNTEAEVGMRRKPGEQTRYVTAVEVTSSIADFGGESLISYDGRLWAGHVSAHWTDTKAGLCVSGDYLENGFKDLRSGRGLAGARYLSLKAHRNLTKYLKFSGSSLWSRWQPARIDIATPGLLSPVELASVDADAWQDSRDYSIEAGWTSGPHLLANSWWRSSDTEISEPHWRRRRAGAEMGVQNLTVAKVFDLSVGLKVGWEHVNEQADSPIDGTYRWSTLLFDPRMGFFQWLTITGHIEQRFAREDSPAEPSDCVWEAKVEGPIPAVGPLTKCDLVAAYRKWENLNTTDGKFNTGRHISAGLDIISRPWHGLSLEMATSWNRDPDEDTDDFTIHVGLVSYLGFGETPRRGRENL